MKKVRGLLVAATVLVAFTVTSCKKDYTCVCTVKDNTGAVISTSNISIHTTKGKAKDACTASVSTTSGTSSMTETCAIQ